MLHLLIFTSFFISAVDQDNIFKNTIEIFTTFNQSIHPFDYEKAANDLHKSLFIFCNKYSIKDIQEHSLHINNLLIPFLEQSRPGTFNSALYSNSPFIEQLESAGKKEWCILSDNEKNKFCKTLHAFDIFDKYICKKSYPAEINPAEFKKLVVTAYIISLAKPL